MINENAFTQEFTSASTSINKDRTPAIYNLVYKVGRFDKPFRAVLDYGCGKYTSHLAQFLLSKCQLCAFYDPYNQSERVNQAALNFGKEHGYDTVLCSNVLNVIKEREQRLRVLTECAKHVRKRHGIVYITVYEGDGSGTGRITGGDSWQENRKTKDYISEIELVFRYVEVRGKLIIARN